MNPEKGPPIFINSVRLVNNKVGLSKRNAKMSILKRIFILKHNNTIPRPLSTNNQARLDQYKYIKVTGFSVGSTHQIVYKWIQRNNPDELYISTF